MQVSQGSSSCCIKPNARQAVKLGFVGILFCLAMITGFPFSYAEYIDDEPEFHGNLPPIEAKTYPLRTVARSDSNKIYLFDDLAKKTPPNGQILLLKKDGTNAMAFRVVRSYQGKNLFAAKRVRKYKNFPYLEDGESFVAVEKVSDLSNVPKPTTQDQMDLKELEDKNSIQPPPPDPDPPPPPPPPGPIEIPLPAIDPELDDDRAITLDPDLDTQSTLAYDPDLDGEQGQHAEPIPSSGQPPPLPGSDTPAQNGDTSITPPQIEETATASPSALPPPSPEDIDAVGNIVDNEVGLGLTLDETEELDRRTSWLTAGFGFVLNQGPPAFGGYYYFASGNMRYGLTVAKKILFSQNTQDSLAVEGGFYLYKALNFSIQGDSYTVLPLVATLRYNIFFNENYGIFFYGGILKNSVVASSSASSATLSALTNFFPAAGFGGLLQIGPSWFIRADIGIESLTANLILRF